MEMDGDVGGRAARAADPVSRMWELVKERLSAKPHQGASPCVLGCTHLPRLEGGGVADRARSPRRRGHRSLRSLLTPLSPLLRTVVYEDALNQALRSGHSREDFERFCTEYEGLGIITVNASRTLIVLATSGV